MAKRAATLTARTDHHQNKSLAIRMVLKGNRKAPTDDIIAAVKSEYGHTVVPTTVYMVKTKMNLKKGKRSKKAAAASGAAGGNSKVVARTKKMSTDNWVDAIKLARQLLAITGDAASAKVTLYGQEKDAATSGLARMNMFLH